MSSSESMSRGRPEPALATIAVAPGDGVGPDIMAATLRVLRAAGVPLAYETVTLGAEAARTGVPTAIRADARRTVERSGVLLRAPTASTCGGHRRVPIAAQRLWGTYANKRVFRLLPGVSSPLSLSHLELTMFRESVEDTHVAIEHMPTPDVGIGRRMVTRAGSLKLHRYAFAAAARKGARRITCAHEVDLMPRTDGMFLECFYETAADYPLLQADDVAVGTLATELLLDPAAFDVVVLGSRHGDVIMDLAAGLIGGQDYAPSASVGDGIAIFEAMHGAAPDLVGRDLANPSALILSATMMLRHLGLIEHATLVELALEEALFDLHRGRRRDGSRLAFSATRLIDDVVARLERSSDPAYARARRFPVPRRPVATTPHMLSSGSHARRPLRGVDVFLSSPRPPEELAAVLADRAGPLPLQRLLNRGTEVWPQRSNYTDCVPFYQARFVGTGPVKPADVLATLAGVSASFEIGGAEWLYRTGRRTQSGTERMED
ncbi:MAG: isocitrate/isopropylmalate family dehydrogenase [Myxococcota bacterium]